MAKKRKKARRKPTKLTVSFSKTLKMREQIKPEFHPLFDHMIVLAKDSAKGKYPYQKRRAGRELRHARKLSRH